ncbi:MAG: T9SS type A sorting domain-containing protein [Bacteroidota bacterium]
MSQSGKGFQQKLSPANKLQLGSIIVAGGLSILLASTFFFTFKSKQEEATETVLFDKMLCGELAAGYSSGTPLSLSETAIFVRFSRQSNLSLQNELHDWKQKSFFAIGDEKESGVYLALENEFNESSGDPAMVWSFNKTVSNLNFSIKCSNIHDVMVFGYGPTGKVYQRLIAKKGEGEKGRDHSNKLFIPEAILKVEFLPILEGADKWDMFLGQVSYCIGKDTDQDGQEDHVDVDVDNDGMTNELETKAIFYSSERIGNNSFERRQSNLNLSEPAVISQGHAVHGNKFCMLKGSSKRYFAPLIKQVQMIEGQAYYINAFVKSQPSDSLSKAKDYHQLAIVDAWGDSLATIRPLITKESTEWQKVSFVFTPGRRTQSVEVGIFVPRKAAPLAVDGLEIYTYDPDPDGDGLAVYEDLDSDNDGIPDIVECGMADVDGDGRKDTDYPPVELKQDSVDERFMWDFDQDRVANFVDLDSDNDGLLDIIEAGGLDKNKDGMVDMPSRSGEIAFRDQDRDGFFDGWDGDPQNDGISENTANVLIPTSADLNEDSYPDMGYPNGNRDKHGLPDFLDIDSDNDGIVDLIENQPTHEFAYLEGKDEDHDGLDDVIDDFEGFGGSGTKMVHSDRDMEPDYLDLDSDEDGRLDELEGHDTNFDGFVDSKDKPVAGVGKTSSFKDADRDGLLDGFDNSLLTYDASNGKLSPEDFPAKENASPGWRTYDIFPMSWKGVSIIQIGENAILKWQTAAEVNSDYFDIERSLDGRIFKPLSRVGAAGNKAETSSYKYADLRISRIPADVIFYRLKQVDFDGKYEYSDIVSLEIERIGSLQLELQTSQDSESARLSFGEVESTQINVKVYSMLGKEVYSQSTNKDQLDLPISNWKAGTYLIEVEDGENTRSEKLVLR